MSIEVIYSVIATDKMEESVAFYQRHFGFETVADVGFYKQLRAADGAELAFMEPDHPSQPPLFQPRWNGQGLILSIQVDAVEPLYEKIKLADVPIAFDLKKEAWGQLHFGIVDPNGIPVDVVQHV